jgi:uncharacterized membrane-anchored protein YitT (DUF2179 family)
MKKLLSLIMISLSWIIGMTAIFTFDQIPSQNGQSSSVQTSIEFSQSYEFEISSTNLSVNIPNFKIDWKLFGKYNTVWEIISRSILTELALQEFIKKSFVLFDIKSIFLHFFYPW